MQYVRNLSDSVSTAWNSINPATLSGAIDVIVVEHEDGSLSCSPFHVEFRINGVKQEYSMKLGEGGEAFFVFETTDTIPESLQTSPLVSPANSPPLDPASELQDPDPLELNDGPTKSRRPPPAILQGRPDDNGILTPLSASPALSTVRPVSDDWSSAIMRPHSEDVLRQSARAPSRDDGTSAEVGSTEEASDRSHSPPPLAPKEAIERAHALSKELSAANIPTQVTETGDLMLDMTGFKSCEEDMLRAEVLARKMLSEELDGSYDIGALFGFDEMGNLWIYSSEEAKQAAMNKTIDSSLAAHRHTVDADAVSDPGYQSDASDVTASPRTPAHRRSESDAGPSGIQTPPRTPPESAHARYPVKNYAKTLRLTSDQLKELDLKPGENLMSFTVNRATCSANMYLWLEETPVVISDIDGTITKSDALGHVLNMIGRDWTHSGVAKLYSDIALNGYNIMYLTSRSVGQADTTRAYLNGIVQEGYKMPHGPTILSPDRTMAALRREIYLRKPHIFKMATLRDIRNLYGNDRTPFYAGFGNRLTDQISYRTVDVPRTRIFTINSNSEVSLDLLSLNKLKMSYVNINEVVDHYFPPVGTLVKGGGEEYTDFKYWRNDPLALDEFSASDSEDQDIPADLASTYSEDDDEETGEGLADSYISRGSLEEGVDEDQMADSMMTVDEDADDGNAEGEYDDGYEDDDEYDEDDAGDAVEPAKKRKPSVPHFVAEDVSAEVITGFSQIGVDSLAGQSSGRVEEPVEIRALPEPRR
ncbi:LNS2 (Lipin/Ned1/Smp2) domain-containing protein [Hirsutella rhossiliensis]|uniref:LNS2 (Lipin/Ned1/Smp2) domain-containing protein n=1 Tax=Hirsutella rhossiliensis TaxID=111463 RepID=A0A9P8MY69_9HYPO|nr:LNS2 (Lipin/Ned1/Smp2) domain-containing protein [Hirsutella rhossiliensis]KAH0962456.1 LNS2 (Lipin/Ned1/Smp2) domain-containing protein [Hirsutella rhossiliensis]